MEATEYWLGDDLLHRPAWPRIVAGPVCGPEERGALRWPESIMGRSDGLFGRHNGAEDLFLDFISMTRLAPAADDGPPEER